MIIETTVEKAKLEIKHNPAKLNIERKRNGLSMQSRPTKMVADYTDFYESLGIYTNSRLTEVMKERSRQALLQSIAQYADNGNAMLAQGKEAIPMIALQKMQENLRMETQLAFIPARPNISWEIGGVDIRYTPDELTISWETGKPEYYYIPAQIHTRVVQWNSVEIEYLGEPNYFPPSSKPEAEQSSGFDRVI